MVEWKGFLKRESIVLALQVFWHMRVLHREEADLGHVIWHFLLPLAAGLLFVGTATGFLLGEPLALFGLSVTDLLCLTIGLRNTWVLMIWLLVSRAQQQEQASNNAGHKEKEKII